MFYSPLLRSDTFLVNTQSGQIWQETGAASTDTVFETVDVNPVATRSNKSGRYTIYFSPHVAADTYLLDTYTGREWQIFKDAKTNNTFFGEVSVRTISEVPPDN